MIPGGTSMLVAGYGMLQSCKKEKLDTSMECNKPQ